MQRNRKGFEALQRGSPVLKNLVAMFSFKRKGNSLLNSLAIGWGGSPSSKDLVELALGKTSPAFNLFGNCVFAVLNQIENKTTTV